MSEGGSGALALSWSGGKDSALALRALREEMRVEPVALLTTITEDYDRISMHAVRSELLRAQARATGIELIEIPIPAGCVNATYEERMEAALGSPPLDRVPVVAFGDLFLEEVRAYREERLTGAGRSALFPLWGRDTAALAREFIATGFEATLVSVDPRQLDADFVGRRFDDSLLADLPEGVDPCGENGEFHTFVHGGPIFDAPIPVELGEVVTRDGFAFQDLLLVEDPPPAVENSPAVRLRAGGGGAGDGASSPSCRPPAL
ncbi:MAG TPA: ATP-binding protein [Solirubrobacterales bacterium]|nr:ATP-binding protein [Solirubrobacterales bacterium]